MEYKTSDKAREGNRRRNKRWRESNEEHVKALNRRKAMAHYYRNQEDTKTKMRERARARWAAMTEEERKDYKLRECYGIGLVEWNAMLEAQNFRCAACDTDDPGKRGWQTDHCHTQGHIRGLLCTKCNTGIGLANEDTERLKRWIEYLERNTKQAA